RIGPQTDTLWGDAAEFLEQAGERFGDSGLAGGRHGKFLSGKMTGAGPFAPIFPGRDLQSNGKSPLLVSAPGAGRMTTVSPTQEQLDMVDFSGKWHATFG